VAQKRVRDKKRGAKGNGTKVQDSDVSISRMWHGGMTVENSVLSGAQMKANRGGGLKKTSRKKGGKSKLCRGQQHERDTTARGKGGKKQKTSQLQKLKGDSRGGKFQPRWGSTMSSASAMSLGGEQRTNGTKNLNPSTKLADDRGNELMEIKRPNWGKRRKKTGESLKF